MVLDITCALRTAFDDGDVFFTRASLLLRRIPISAISNRSNRKIDCTRVAFFKFYFWKLHAVDWSWGMARMRIGHGTYQWDTTHNLAFLFWYFVAENRMVASDRCRRIWQFCSQPQSSFIWMPTHSHSLISLTKKFIYYHFNLSSPAQKMSFAFIKS